MSRRIESLDVGRGFAVFCMIVVHALWVYGNKTIQDNSWFGHVMHFFGKGTASFLIAMGFCFITSSKQSISSAVLRGFALLVLGYVMNFLKFIPPALLFNSMPENFVATYGWTLPLSFEQLKYMVKTGDILQFFGLSIIVLAFIRALVNNKFLMLVVAIGFAFLTPFITGREIDVKYLGHLVDLFVSKDFKVFFPVFPWISGIIFGMFLGMWFLELDKREELIFSRMFIYGLSLLVVGAILCFSNWEYHFGDFFHLGPGGIIYLSGYSFIAWWIFHIWITKLGSNPFFEFLKYLSRNVTSIYVIQAVLIGWGMGVFGFQQHGAIGLLWLVPLSFLVTVSAQTAYSYAVSFITSKKN